MELTTRAERHLALGDVRRLKIVDLLARGDHTVSDLAGAVDMPSNLLAHHLEVLETAGLIERQISEGDRRKRYVRLSWDAIPPPPMPDLTSATVAFVCTHNSARSQFAAAMWEQVTGAEVVSAGTHPAEEIHPKAVTVAAEFGIDLSGRSPSGYESIPWKPDLIVSVCDRAFEGGVPESSLHLHWSIPDPVPVGSLASFRSAFGDIARRVGHLTGSAA